MTQGERRIPARRTVLGAAGATVLGASTALAAGTGAAQAAESRTAGAAHGHGRGYRSLPVPTVIAHRGASGYRPEHTLGSYRHALDLGAHVIEQDLVPTKDGHLVCRHENDITGTTDVADHPEFASRKTTKSVDGVSLTGWFTEDFTLAELKTLRAKERIPAVRQENTLYDGRWTVPTFEEVLRWADEEGRRRGREIWLHVETKHPSYFRSLGLGLEERLAKLLRRYGRHRANSPVFLQSFEPSSIQRLAKLVDSPGVVLLSGATSRPWDFVQAGDPRTVADLVTPGGLRWIASYARGIGPTLDLVIPKDASGRLGDPTTLVRDAHAAGLILHPYTHRNENSFLPADFRRGTDPTAYGDSFGALKTYLATGIDGIFSDNPDTALLGAADFTARD
ncbi:MULTISPECIES: glycerophosphodiester phosphodiesterase [Streptomyces]|uniref:glycerophosphodiester phosphodiesterase n=1 Tax=Streptomyces venezuelae (strain ATCC 10712 / CBS 650.69 / DSM 40230 / JCM 4526 / NBRC 13096 / PD 04745) TaxID=953739 RepID=F2RCU2_STRVP|nr:glycerophosphodiester phosphodiesterase [Streptomyces venezuelae]APE20545.1 glycerophosphodiester phosphodiesterase [Streptomyces venezuelae]QER97936.1 glycerophosphodiester phosphodiesterase [Streptomyces venezuelae ATCC 10712]CCA54450.1 Glycerophosphoryl diester phosphodiesterase [Streptomyces venezuelae ATCC 10712]